MNQISRRAGITNDSYRSDFALASLNLIDRGKFAEIESDGEMAFFVVGEVELGYANLVDDSDRILPRQAVKSLQPMAERLLHPSVRLAESHLAAFAKARGLRDSTAKGKHDDQYCKYDDLADRWFYRTEFLRLLERSMRDDPIGVAADLRLGTAVRAAVESRFRASSGSAPRGAVETH